MRRLLLLACALLLAACSRPEPAPPGPGETVPDVRIDPKLTRTDAGELGAGRTFGQTFTSTKNGLARIEILVATYTKTIPAGTLEIHLRSGPGAAADLAKVSIPAATIKDNSYVALEFPPIRDSAGKTYYFYAETHDIPAGFALTVWRSNADVYPDGNFFVDGRPQAWDASFVTYVRTR